MTKTDALFLTKMSLKNPYIPFEAGHTYIAHIRDYSSLLGHGQSQREVSQINTFLSALMCRELGLIYSYFFSTIGSVIYLPSTKNPRPLATERISLAQIIAAHLQKSPSSQDFSCTSSLSQTEYLSGNEIQFPSDK